MAAAAAAAKSLQLCPTLCDPIDSSPPGSPVPGILHARTLEWVAISFSNTRKWKVKVNSLSRVRRSATTWTAAYQAPPSMGFSRQEYRSGVPLAAYQAPPSMGFSRQEYCSGVPLPSPCHMAMLCYAKSLQSDSVRPHRQQPTRLPHPWDSPRKNTGVGCHFLLQCMKVKSEREVAQSCPTLSDLMDCSLPRSSIHGIFQARVLEWGAIAFNMVVFHF